MDVPVMAAPRADRAGLLKLRLLLHPEVGRILVAAVLEHEAVDLDVAQAPRVRRKDPPPRRELDQVTLRPAGGEVHEQFMITAVIPPGVGLRFHLRSKGHLLQLMAVDEDLPQRVDEVLVGLGIAGPFLAEVSLILRPALAAPWRARQRDLEGIAAVHVRCVGEHGGIDRRRPDCVGVPPPLGFPLVRALDHRLVPCG